MDSGFRAYLVGAGLSDAQIASLSPECLLSARRDYQQSIQSKCY
jgi:hypothetical protein